MMYKLCVFDMDGTFIDSIGDIAAAMNRSLKKLGHTTFSENDYYKMVGNGMEVLCRRALPKSSEDEIQELIRLYKTDYLANCCIKTKPYDGMVELNQKLIASGIKTAILSNKPHSQVIEIAETLSLNSIFDIIMGQSERYPSKPAPDALLAVMEKLNASADETVYIGDSDVDIQLAKAANVTSVGVKWGFRGEAELKRAGANFIVSDAGELASVILR